MKANIYLTTILLTCIICQNTLSAQILSESTFYSVSSSSPNLLYQKDASSNNWEVVGETGTNNLKALAYHNENNILYGIDEGVLGTINLQTGQFNTIGLINLGDGVYDEVILDNVEALTYDPFSGLLFAIQRIPGEGEATNDLFFKIDPLTGFIVKDAVFDFKNRRFDYVPVPEILREGTSIKDILGLAINPLTYDLVALHSQNGQTTISNLNKRTGEIESVLYNSNSPFSDISYDASGNLFAIIGDSNNTQSNTFVFINVDAGTESILPNITSDPAFNFQSLASSGVEMQALDNDLALRFNLSSDQENPTTQGAIVSFDLTVFNQGELKVDEVRLSVEIDKDKVEILDLGIDQSNWIRLGDRIYGSFKTDLSPGDTYTTSFKLQLKDDFKGMMNFTAEIFHAFNKNITNGIGKFTPLSDIDSNYDELNNEINIIDNIINGGGYVNNEDEDDHDIAMIEVERANNLIFSPCYTVSSQENADNILFEFNPATEKWTKVGITGGTSIGAIATDPVNNLIYAVDEDTFGIINVNSGVFTPYGKIGFGDGVYGVISLDNIKGLTYDPVNEVMYAVHRIEGDGPGTNDLFFQIDVSTGGIIPVAMQDPETDSPVDYVIIPEVFISSLKKSSNSDIYDVSDIAYNVYTGQLFAIHILESLSEATLTEINPQTGEIEAVIYDIQRGIYIEGLGFTSLGELYGTLGDMGSAEEKINNFVEIDLNNSTTTLLGKIDPDDGVPPAEQVDFEAFDCFTAYNDLALRMEVDPSIQQPISAGSTLNFIIDVFNQGDFENKDISIINYIPTGLILADTNWEDLGNGTAIYIYNKSIEPGTSFEIPISFIIDENFEGEDITNTAEIASSFNPQIFDPTGNPIPLPDWDSFPDDQNNEILVTDNEINGGGYNANQDEDDHDIAVVEVEELIITPQPYNTLTKFNCYTVSEDNAAPNVLFEFDVFTGKWAEVGVTGGTFIEAIATDPVNGIIYATDAGQFGTIDANTAVFTPIGTGVGTALTGTYGNLQLDDIDGLTYDPVNEIMYATHRIGGTGPGTNDLLFQIDVSTGNFVPGAMIDASTGNPSDYAVIPEIYGGTLKKGKNLDLYDVDDIAYNPYTGQLFALQNQDGPGAISVINSLTGEVEAFIFDLPDDDLESLGFNSLGQLYGTIGDNGTLEESSNILVYIDLASAITKTIGKIDPDNERVDFEAFDCFTAYNDLALKIEVNKSTEQPVLAENTVDFVITIYNQGDFNSSDITLTNYIPNGLELTDALWMDTGNGTATHILNETLEPGATATTHISFKVAEGFEGQTLTNAVEISASFSPVIIDEEGNFYTGPMPDLDSYPDDINNEVNVSDNEINAGGLNANQDEDDHDIAVIEVEEQIVLPTDYNKLNKFNCYTVSSEENAPNVLFEYDPETDNWTEVGITEGVSIEAIATDPVTGIIYATDAGTFGIIDANTALFIPIGEVGSGNGEAGLIDLNDVDGLTYDPVNQIMYGTHRIEGKEPGTNDLFFQIDVATGKVIPEAMLNPADNKPVDYVIIPEVFDHEFAGSAYNVDDIAYNTYTKQLFALHSQSDYRLYTISELNPMTGELEAVIYDLRANIKGIGFSNFGELFGTTGKNDYPAENSNSFFYIDLIDSRTSQLNFIDPTNQHKEFEAFDCFTAYNDLALLLDVESQQSVNTGSTVTFLLTIFNQGDFPNTNITLTNYIPDGLTLADGNWMDIGDGKATHTFEGILKPGEDHIIRIAYVAEPGFEGQTLTNTAEISSSTYSPDATNILSPGLTAYPDAHLPDWDSRPDTENNETNVVDNELNGGGPNSVFLKVDDEDEDDHDIAVIQVEQDSCPINLVIPDGEISGHFQAQQEIDIQGYVKKSKTAVFDICQ